MWLLFIAIFLAGTAGQYCIDRAVVYVMVVSIVLLVILVAALVISKLCPKKIKVNCERGNFKFGYEQDGAEPNDELTRLSSSASEADIRSIQDHEHQVFLKSLRLDSTWCESST